MRVFISHTEELRRFPRSRSFVHATERAIIRTGGVVVDMEYFAAQEASPEELCRNTIKSCDVYVALLGFRYGSPAAGHPDTSHTEMEFRLATQAGIPRLVFLLHEDAEVPFGSFVDREYGAKQDAFRQRVIRSGLVTGYFHRADELETLTLHALIELEKKKGTHVDRIRDTVSWMVPARSTRFVDRPRLMSDIMDLIVGVESGAVALTTVLEGTGGFGKTTLAEEVCRRSQQSMLFPGGILWVTLGESITGLALAAKINNLSLKLSSQHPTFSDPEAAGFHLGGLLGDEVRLVVIDDVWTQAQLRPFLVGGSRSVRLVTTRNRGALPDNAAVVVVDTMTRNEARELLLADLTGASEAQVEVILILTGK